MPIPLLPILVGVVCFAVGLGAASTIKFVQADGQEASMDEYWGEPCLVTCKDGQEYEGNLQELSEEELVLEVGEQRFTTLPLKDLQKVEVFAN